MIMAKKEEINEEELLETGETNVVDNSQEETSDKAAEQPAPEDLLEKANAEIADLKDKNLRMMAEFDNYRRRTAKEKIDLQKMAGEGIFTEMLSLVDDFERAEKAMAACEDVKALRDGLDLIYKKFVSFLEKNDVHAIETENAVFDVDLHEAITTFAAGEEMKGKIIDCTQKGYTLGEKVIRYAKVVVGE